MQSTIDNITAEKLPVQVPLLVSIGISFCFRIFLVTVSFFSFRVLYLADLCQLLSARRPKCLSKRIVTIRRFERKIGFIREGDTATVPFLWVPPCFVEGSFSPHLTHRGFLAHLTSPVANPSFFYSYRDARVRDVGVLVANRPTRFMAA